MTVLLDGPVAASGSEVVTGAVHSTELSTGVDGPGVRYVVFTAGCPLRCLYCHNPDTWQMRGGTVRSAESVLADVARYRGFISAAGSGGLTVSGGEPLLQPRFVAALLAGARDLGLHTALDTSGALGSRAGAGLLDATDLVLLDIKSWDRALYRRLTSVDLEPTLRFACRLADRGTPVWLRFVLVPDLTDGVANVAGVARFAATLGNVERVDVLPFHRMGTAKYEALGLPYALAGTQPPSAALLERVRGQFREAGLAAF